MSETVSLSDKIAAKRAGRLATMPTCYRKLFERSYAGKVSPRTAIKCFCLECVGFERAAITDCAARRKQLKAHHSSEWRE